MASINKISVKNNEYIWEEKYRPQTLDDIILPEDIKNDIRSWIKSGEIPNLLLTSKSPGLGKSSLAHVIIKELQAEAKFINASLERNIDTLRIDIQGFVSTASFEGRPKIIVLDEADGLNEQSVQPALRGFIEQFSKNARFILTANYKDKIIHPLRDRLQDIDFDEIFEENKTLIIDVYKRAQSILENEGIEYESDDLKKVIKTYYPSFRSIVKKLQQFSFSGKLVLHKNAQDSEKILDTLIENVINKDFNNMRKNISNIIDTSIIYTYFYENLDKFPMEKHPPIVITLAKYQANDGLVRDKVVNTAGCLTELMGLF
jgi:DNA polymerase III delta prime subunit